MSDEIVDVAPKEQPARVALSVELVNDVLTYLAARFTLPHLARDIPDGQVASGIFLAALSMAVGLTNAACMTY